MSELKTDEFRKELMLLMEKFSDERPSGMELKWWYEGREHTSLTLRSPARLDPDDGGSLDDSRYCLNRGCGFRGKKSDLLFDDRGWQCCPNCGRSNYLSDWDRMKKYTKRVRTEYYGEIDLRKVLDDAIDEVFPGTRKGYIIAPYNYVKESGMASEIKYSSKETNIDFHGTMFKAAYADDVHESGEMKFSSHLGKSGNKD